MKYRTIINEESRSVSFLVTISDTEWQVENYNKLMKFENVILSYLARMIAGFWFKHHREELMEPIIKEVQERVSKEISRDILSRLGLPLDGSS